MKSLVLKHALSPHHAPQSLHSWTLSNIKSTIFIWNLCSATFFMFITHKFNNRSHMYAFSQKCGLHYQRVEESVGDAIASTRDAKSPILSKEFRFAEWGLNAQADRDEDVIEQFRRVQLICPGVKTPSGKAKQTGKQSPKFPSSYWSSNEQRRFRSLFQTYGTDWITIANRLKTKTPIMVIL